MKNKKLGWRFFFSFFFLLFSVLSFFSSGIIESQDGQLYLTVSRNMYYRHRATSAPYEFNEGKNIHMNSSKGVDGQWRAPGGLGYSLAMVPAVALSDIFHRYYKTSPPEHFPLESDWTVLFFASFTNAFLAAILGVVLVKYGLAVGFSNTTAVLFCLATIFTTNLFPLSKFSFPHMMFITFLVLTFYCVKRYAQTKKSAYIVLGVLSYIVLAVSYNASYILPIPAILLYIILLQHKEIRRLRTYGVLVVLGCIGILFWKTSFILDNLQRISIKTFIEGAWGLLLSPGKSIFLYSPPLLLVLLFWQNIRKNIRPELLSSLLLFLTYIVAYAPAVFWIQGTIEHPIWHGGMVWGPRYVAVLIPFFMLLVFHILSSLSPKQKFFFVIPLFLTGLYIQILGVFVPYLVQYRNLPYDIFVNDREWTQYDFASFLPRYSPVFTMTRDFLTKIVDFPKTLSHGKYEVKLYDGFEVPMKVKNEVWRGIRKTGYISFRNTAREPASAMSFLLYNAPDIVSSTYSAQLRFSLNHHTLSTITTIPSFQTSAVQIELPSALLLQGVNSLDLLSTYIGTTSAQHVLYVKSMSVNTDSVNLQTLDYPDVSSGLGEKTTRIPYRYWGKDITDPWKLWNLRSRIYEETFDFWWLKNLYYWDRPQTLLFALSLLNVLAVIGFWKITLYFFRYRE